MFIYISTIYFFFLIIFNTLATNNIDFIVVNKSDRMISTFKNGRNLKNFNISLGFAPQGEKVKKGDGKTPEGLYFIEQKLENSAFYLALKVSYPNPWDIRRALKLDYHPGGQIMIHGIPNKGYDDNFHNSFFDWTEGCIALSNKEILYLWKKTKIGTPILILK